MATLLFSAIGTLIGGPLGGAIGALAGRSVDSLVFGGGTREGPRLSELGVTTSSYGMPIPRQFGRMRVAGQMIWATDLVEHRDKQGNGKGKPSTVTYTYTASFAVALSSRPISAIGRVWADGKLLRGAGGDLTTAGTMRQYSGHSDQMQDPLLAAADGEAATPAYRGLAYAVFEDLQLTDFGNRIPALTFEVLAGEDAVNLADLLDGTIVDADADVVLDGVSGFACEGPLAETLGTLEPLFPIDCDACGEKLILLPERYQTAPIAMAEAAVSPGQDDFGAQTGFVARRAAPSSQPVELVRYYDIDRDYQPGAQRATGRPAPGQPRAVDLPAAMTAAAARSLANTAARRVNWSRQTVSWRTNALDPAVRPGGAVRLPDHPGTWRVKDWEWREHGVELTLVRAATVGSATYPTDSGRAVISPDLPIGPTALAAFEMPWDGNPATAVPWVIAAASSSGPGWPGAGLFVDQGDGALLPAGTTGRHRATIGLALTALAAATPLLFDRSSSVDVQLAADDLGLSGATHRQLAMGANRALLGEEIVQFARADALGGGIWRLSGFFRGRGGTEHAVGSHTVGDRFVLLDGSGTAIDGTLLGETATARVAAIGLADATPVITRVHLPGIGQRPLSPVHGLAAQLADGAVRLAWTRRSRGSWAWRDAVPTPLNEEVELYEVWLDGSVASPLRWTVSQPTFTLSAAEMALARSASPNPVFGVRQMGSGAASLPLWIAAP